MNRSFGTACSAAVIALALSACGGGGSGTVPATAQAPQTSSGAARHASSTCTPDSYGYCLAYTGSHTYYHYYCYTSDGFALHTSTDTTTYELYHGSTDSGQYTQDVRTTCDGTDTTWTPQDPRTATGDPNLP